MTLQSKRRLITGKASLCRFANTSARSANTGSKGSRSSRPSRCGSVRNAADPWSSCCPRLRCGSKAAGSTRQITCARPAGIPSRDRRMTVQLQRPPKKRTPKRRNHPVSPNLPLRPSPRQNQRENQRQNQRQNQNPKRENEARLSENVAMSRVILRPWAEEPVLRCAEGIGSASLLGGEYARNTSLANTISTAHE
jgi:hypothetical protein